jgi:hypothetical protein
MNVAAVDREITAVLRSRTGHECLPVPLGRMALCLTFRGRLPSGERILMSPVNGDVTLFTPLAARLRPVVARLSVEDGKNRSRGGAPTPRGHASAAV